MNILFVHEMKGQKERKAERLAKGLSGDGHPLPRALWDKVAALAQWAFLASSTLGTGWASPRLFVGQRQCHLPKAGSLAVESVFLSPS